MKLLRFPFLPLELILQQLLPIDLISLSCCSKKIRKTIKLARFSTEHRAFATEFKLCPKALCLQIHFPTVRQSLFISFQDTPRDSRRAAKIFDSKINEIQYPFRFVETDEMCILYTGERNGYRIAEYVMDLIRMTDVQKLAIDIGLIPNNRHFFSLKYIENVFYVHLHGESIASESFSTLFNHLKGPFDYILIDPSIEGRLDINFTLTSHTFIFENANWMRREHLLTLRGEYLCTRDTQFDEDDMIAFIKQWRDGTDTTLRNIMIVNNHRAFDEDRLVTEFNAVPWDEERRAKDFVCWGVSISGKKDPVVPCSEGFDFERGDGLLATIQLRAARTKMEFFVWHDRFPVREQE